MSCANLEAVSNLRQTGPGVSETRNGSPPVTLASHGAVRLFQLCFFSLLFIALIVLYFRAFLVMPYGDDLLRLSNAAIHGFDVQYEFEKYRPLERLITAANYSLFGLRATLGVLVNLFGVCVSSFVVWKIARIFRPGSLAYPCTACVFFAFHSINASAVFQIDTISQQYATVFALLAFYWYASCRLRSPLVYHGVGTFLLFLMLMSKEVATGIALALPVVVAVARRYATVPDAGMLRRDVILGIFGSLFATLTFLYLWQTVCGFSMLTVGEGYGRAWSPLKSLRGMALLYSGVVYLGSTLDVLVKADITRMIASGCMTVVLFVLSFGGLAAVARTRAPELRKGLAWSGAASAVALAASFPVCALKQPSELHGYLVVPFFALAATYFVDLGLLKAGSWLHLRARAVQVVGVSLLAVYAAWMSYGTLEKLSLARQVGERSMQYLEQIVAWQESLPEGKSEVCVVGDYLDNATSLKSYSVFVQENRDLIRWIVDGHASVMRPAQTIIIGGYGRETCEYTLQVSESRLQFHATF
jgi:hypothetical protein